MPTFTRITVSDEHASEARRWCRENIGPAKPGKRWNTLQWYYRELSHDITTTCKDGTWMRFPGKKHCFYFRDAAHATLFALMWS